MIQWLAFLVLAGIAVAGALGMLLTMSMYRAAMFLMSSFVALAGLFVLLDADLLAAIQVMMNVGGMLVMLLFMVPLMMDPGGEMMWDMKRQMKLPGLAALSMAMPRTPPPAEDTIEPAQAEAGATYTCPMHPEVIAHAPGTCPTCGMELVPARGEHASHAAGGMMRMSPAEHHTMMVDMAMSTELLPWAMGIGLAAALLVGGILLHAQWSLAPTGPTQDAVQMVGDLLMGRYMLAFEGAAYLILAGIIGAVVLGVRERKP